jgi:lipoprotein-anchoring transpeptidase ErfK/SrfK
MKRFFLFWFFIFLPGLCFTVSAQEDIRSIELTTYVQAQILLDQAGFSPGEIDGTSGYNTFKALQAYQRVNRLAVTGTLDEPTMTALMRSKKSLLVTYKITEQDVTGPFVEVPGDFMEKARLKKLYYSSPLEKISEKFHIAPELLQNLNPDALFLEGEEIVVPNVRTDLPTIQNGKLRVTVSRKNSDVTVSLNGHVIFYAPISHGGKRNPVPAGKRKVNGIIKDPPYKYDPKLFWDAEPHHRPALIPPGPNNPVGKVWIAINLRHVGLHGTPDPSRIGYSESHGCIRLTNWDAQTLAEIVKPGTEVIFQ